MANKNEYTDSEKQQIMSEWRAHELESLARRCKTTVDDPDVIEDVDAKAHMILRDYGYSRFELDNKDSRK